MTENATLTAEQSRIVRELKNNVTAFFAGNAFNAPEELREKHWQVVSNFIELQMEFPEFAKTATTFWEAELPEEVGEFPGYGDALFSLLLVLRSFSVTESLTDFVGLHDSLHDSIYDLSTFSEEFDVEHGFWKEDLNV
jgi:hypothetical protein